MKADRDILERAVAAVAEQAAQTDALVHEAVEIGIGGSAPLTIHAKLKCSSVVLSPAALPDVAGAPQCETRGRGGPRAEGAQLPSVGGSLVLIVGATSRALSLRPSRARNTPGMDDEEELAEVIDLDAYRWAKEAAVRPYFVLDDQGRWQPLDTSRAGARSRHPSTQP